MNGNLVIMFDHWFRGHIIYRTCLFSKHWSTEIITILVLFQLATIPKWFLEYAYFWVYRSLPDPAWCLPFGAIGWQNPGVPLEAPFWWQTDVSDALITNKDNILPTSRALNLGRSWFGPATAKEGSRHMNTLSNWLITIVTSCEWQTIHTRGNPHRGLSN